MSTCPHSMAQTLPPVCRRRLFNRRPGDVSGIEMQEVPQTQFIPLPDSLCLVILDLNNNRVVATVDTIKEKLRKSFRHMQIPEDWLIHNTLGNLIRERKLLHNGTGYFVVTPDTFLVPPMDPNLAWLPYHTAQQIPQQSQLPKYPQAMMQHPAPFQRIPQQGGNFQGFGHQSAAVHQEQVCYAQPQNCLHHNMRTITRSACCQTEEHGKTKTDKTAERTIKRGADKLVNENDVFSTDRRGRSHSVNCNRRSGANAKGNVAVVRSSSVKQRNEKSKSDKEKNQKNDIEKVKGEKVSIFAKLFGKHRNKKDKDKNKEKDKKSSTTEPIKEVEYATFSAQFPPPEWVWYQQQLNKQQRVEAWVKTQNNNAGTNGVDADTKDNKHQRSHKDRKSHRESKKSHRINTHKAMCPHDHGFKISSEVNKENQRPHTDDYLQMPMRYQGSELATGSLDRCGDGTTATRQPSRPDVVNQRPCREDEPLPPRLPVHSTPLYDNKHHPPSRPCNRCQCDESYIEAPLHDIHQNHTASRGRDIDYHVVGKLSKKHTKMSQSRDSGVNVIGKSETEHKSHHHHRHRKSKHVSQTARLHRSAKPSQKAHASDKASSENVDQVINSDMPYGHQNLQTTENVYENIDDVKNVHMNTLNKIENSNELKVPEYDAQKRCNGMQLSENSVDDSEFSYNTAIHVTQAVIHNPIDRMATDTKELAIADSGLGQSQDTNYSEDSDRIHAFDNKICDGIYFSKPCNSLRDLNNGPDVNIGEEAVETVYEKFTEDSVSRQNTNSVNLLNNQIEKYTQKTSNLSKSDDIKYPDDSGVQIMNDVDLLKHELQGSKRFDVTGDFEVVGIV